MTLPRMKDRSSFSLCWEAQCGSDKESLESLRADNTLPMSWKTENINLSAADGWTGTKREKMIDRQIDDRKTDCLILNYFISIAGIAL